MAETVCKYCGETFDSTGKFLGHLRACPGRAAKKTAPFIRPPDSAPAKGDKQEDSGKDEVRAACVIPLSACPDEVRLLTSGASVGLRVVGRLTPAGVAVDTVELIR